MKTFYLTGNKKCENEQNFWTENKAKEGKQFFERLRGLLLGFTDLQNQCEMFLQFYKFPFWFEMLENVYFQSRTAWMKILTRNLNSILNCFYKVILDFSKYLKYHIIFLIFITIIFIIHNKRLLFKFCFKITKIYWLYIYMFKLQI